MNKISIGILMALIGFGAMADGVVSGGRVGRSVKLWVRIFTDSESTTYARPRGIRTQGDKAVMWSLVDYNAARTRAPAAAPFLSEKFEDEYDCSGKQFRTLSFSRHPANMGSGPAVFDSSEATDWQAILPASDIELLWALACENADAIPSEH